MVRTSDLADLCEYLVLLLIQHFPRHQEQIFDIIRKISVEGCNHENVREVCHVCGRDWYSDHCRANDPAKRINCEDCLWETLS